MNQPKPDGLFSEEEVPLLEAIENDLVDSLQDSATFSGRITTGGYREFYFYSGAPEFCENTIAATMRKHGLHRFDIGSRNDEAWSRYLDFLYPSAEIHQQMKNRSVIELLMQHGDQLAKSRPVSHWAYFPTLEEREAFIAAAIQHGFAFANRSANEENPSARPYGVTLEKANSMEEIDDTTIALLHLADSHHGEYDGWETSVEKEQ